MRKILLLITVMFMTATMALAQDNYYVRSDVGSTVTWNVLTQVNDIFTEDASGVGAGSFTEMPGSNDNLRVYNGVELVINVDAEFDRIYVRETDSKLTANGSVTAFDHMFFYSNGGELLSYIDELDFNTSVTIRGAVKIKDMTVASGQTITIDGSTPPSVVYISDVQITGALANEGTISVDNPNGKITFIYVSEDGDFGRITDESGTFIGTYGFKQKLYSTSDPYAGGIPGWWIQINSPFGTTAQGITDDGYTWCWPLADVTGCTDGYASTYSWDESDNTGNAELWDFFHSPVLSAWDVSRGKGFAHLTGTAAWINAGSGTYGTLYLNTDGTVNYSNFNFDVSYTPSAHTDGTAGWNLLANPYLSVIHFSLLSRTNINESYSVFNNEIADFEFWNGVTGGEGSAQGLIPPGKAFWVYANGSSPSLQASANDIYTGTNPPDLKSNGGGDDWNKGTKPQPPQTDPDYIKSIPNGYLNMQEVPYGAVTSIFDYDDVGEYDAGGQGKFVWVNGQGSTSDDEHFGVLDMQPTAGTKYVTLKANKDLPSSILPVFDIDISNSPNTTYYFKYHFQSSWSELTTSEEQTLEDPENLISIGTSGEDGLGYVNFFHLKIVTPFASKSLNDKGDVNVMNNHGVYTFVAPQDDSYELSVYDISGKLIHKGTFTGFTYELNISQSGIYIYNLVGIKETYTGKFVR